MFPTSITINSEKYDNYDFFFEKIMSSLDMHVLIVLSCLQIRVRNGKLYFFILFFKPKHMLWVLKRTVSMRRFF